MNQKVDWFFEKDSKWKKEYQKLRTIILDCGLVEALKWGCPCYTYHGDNIVLIHGFKEYCALLFHKGVLLSDPEKMLIQQTKNVQAARQLRFSSVQEIIELETIVRNYILEAIELEKTGIEVKMKNTTEYEMPNELMDAFKSNADLQTAFNALTPGRQRGYLLYVGQAKQSRTRVSRIEKSIPKILDGKGIHDN